MAQNPDFLKVRRVGQNAIARSTHLNEPPQDFVTSPLKKHSVISNSSLFICRISGSAGHLQTGDNNPLTSPMSNFSIAISSMVLPSLISAARSRPSMESIGAIVVESTAASVV